MDWILWDCLNGFFCITSCYCWCFRHPGKPCTSLRLEYPHQNLPAFLLPNHVSLNPWDERYIYGCDPTWWILYGKPYVDPTKWAPTSYKWAYHPYKWPYTSVTGGITRLMSTLDTPFTTRRGPPCMGHISQLLLTMEISLHYHCLGFTFALKGVPQQQCTKASKGKNTTPKTKILNPTMDNS